MSGVRRLIRRFASQAGYTLIEMITVIAIFGTIMGGLTVLLVQPTNAELDLNNRFQAQSTARVALDKLKREVHCASVAAPSGSAPYSSVTLTLPSQCPTGSGSITWCTQNLGTSRYGLFRVVGPACTGGTKYADYLTTGTVFPSYTPQSPSTLAILAVDLPVNVNPSKSVETYELQDNIVLRNSVRQ